MRKMFNDQKGYALIIVLLIVAIIGIMAPVLVGSVLNSAKQNKLTEEQIQLNHIADMGLVYFQSLENSQKTAITDDIQTKLSENPNYKITKDEAIRILKTYLFISHTVPLSGNQEYQFTITIEQDKINEISNGVEIYYTSIAKKLSDENFEVPPKEGKLTITLDGNSQNDNTGTEPIVTFPPKPSECKPTGFIFNSNDIYGNTCVNGQSQINKKDTITINGTFYVDGDLSLPNGNGSGDTTTLIVNGDLIVTDTLNMGNNAKIIINNGNAYINNIAMKSNNVSFTISKTLYSKTILKGTAGLSANDYKIIQ